MQYLIFRIERQKKHTMKYLYYLLNENMISAWILKPYCNSSITFKMECRYRWERVK